jgi:DNA-binding transcriptional LysR family regulator
MPSIPSAHVSSLDLNLLAPLQALLEERHVSQAAARVGLSQSAMSRVLERLRDVLGDRLLMRAGGRYTLTLRGERLLIELADLMPRIQATLGATAFDPTISHQRFRIATTDYGSNVILPDIVRRIQSLAPHVGIDAVSWDDRSLSRVEGGQVDFAIIGLYATSELHSARLAEDDFACIIDRNHPFRGERMDLKAYLSYPHVGIDVKSGLQPWIDDPLIKRGEERVIAYRTPFNAAVVAALLGTSMICTMARRFAEILTRVVDARIVHPPNIFSEFQYGLFWHARSMHDMGHAWLRDEIIRVSTAKVPAGRRHRRT